MSRLIRLERDFSNLKVNLIDFQLTGSAAATAANYPPNFIGMPFPCQVILVSVRFGTASSSGTLDIKKAASGTATSSGTSILTSTISLAGTANTNVSGVVDPNNGILNTGDWIGLFTGGTLTSLADIGVTIIIDPLRPNP